MFGVRHLALGRHHECRAPLQLLRDRLDDGRIRMTVDERGHVVGKVDARDAVEIRDPAPFAMRRIRRPGLPQHCIAADAPGHHLLGTLEEFLTS